MEGLLTVFLLLAMAAAAWLLLWPALPTLRARIGNWRVRTMLLRSLPASHYRIFHDFSLRPGPLSNAPVDHVVVSPYGVFVIRTEVLSGRIRGTEGDEHWSRARFRSLRRFPNPLRLNQVHIGALQALAGLEARCFHSVVVFAGRVDFETVLPANVTQLGGLLPFIQVRTTELLGFEEAERIAGLLEARRPPPGIQTLAAQIAALRATHGSRFSAKQAMLGTALMVSLLLAAGSLAYRLTETPGQYPARGTEVAQGPFVETAPPPRIDLPGVAAEQRPVRGLTPVTSEMVPADPAIADTVPRNATGASARTRMAHNERLAWESSLKCAYAVETRHCACYEPQGRKAVMNYESCRALADRGAGAQ